MFQQASVFLAEISTGVILKKIIYPFEARIGENFFMWKLTKRKREKYKVYIKFLIDRKIGRISIGSKNKKVWIYRNSTDLNCLYFIPLNFFNKI